MVFDSLFSVICTTVTSVLFSGLFTYSTYDFFYVKKQGSDNEYCTDAENVKKLYKKINMIEKSKRKITNNSPSLILYCMYCTFISIIKFKYAKFLTNYYSPEKLGNHFVATPYFMNNVWYKAVLPHHIKKVPNVIKVISIEEQGNKDVTKIIKQYLGPNEDFNHQLVCPNDLGFQELEFNIFSQNGCVINYNFKNHQIIKLTQETI